ncbi:hypothetical protein CIHG_01469 [Coccidioides immitis H538.4]|uniref:Uncharacterized protein n=1 Tax=Coccidioides immitis H538.4 TaxID=396776 RepID=A0A0J8RFK3_COCIT|nr:hypothetical protein CIHG_01469 [Coccidioides immitis H538.4]TPX25917.1 hypothetical protein DIZ76_011374 [Coccidioides immitis]
MAESICSGAAVPVTRPSNQTHHSSPASTTSATAPTASTTPQPWFLCQDPHFLPAWARSHVKYAQNLLECDDEPIEYDHDELDYRDNCFFFPEDCVYRPPPSQPENPLLLRDWVSNPDGTETDSDHEDNTDDMGSAMLSNIKMLDTSALTDLLEDNLSPPEITSIFIFATNGAVFAHASSLTQRRVRSLCATYGAAYKSYAVSHSNGNLTGINPANHPSSFVTTPSVPLGDVGSIIFELEDYVAVVTKIADKVLLAVVGPTRIDRNTTSSSSNSSSRRAALMSSASSDIERTLRPVDSFPTVHDHLTSSSQEQAGKLASSAPAPGGSLSITQLCSRAGDSSKTTNEDADKSLRAQWEIDRTSDLKRLASLNLSSPPTILLALESKSAALGRFLRNKLADLESPEDF